MGFFMLDIEELLFDRDFIQQVEFGIVSDTVNPFGFDDFFGNLGFGEGRFVKYREPDENGNPQEFESIYRVWANVQPASGNTLQRLPEGERSKPSYQVFTRKNFKIGNADYLYYKGEKYRCVTDENWSDFGYYDGIFQLYSGAQDIEKPTPNPWD